MTMQPPAIEARQLSKTFGATQVLAPLDLIVPRGSILALVGHNGAGKTTLIKLLLNILQPTTGVATVLGQSTATLTSAAFTRIGYVSENQELPDWMTVQSFLDYLRPFYPTWNEAGLLDELDLPPDRKLKHLSRGMRMKAVFASVLAFSPSVILMDEPFSGLDPVVRDELIQTLLGRIHPDDAGADESGATILISSHDLGEIESFATHVAFLHEGTLLFAEPMNTLVTRFREVTVTLARSESAEEYMTNLPDSWLSPESSGAVIRFIYTKADTEAPEIAVRGVFQRAEGIQSESMTLRTIFLALVKANRTEDRRRA
jgi:ABC-2 type transport system ATP-binding protein